MGRKIEVMSVYAGVGRDFGVKFGGAEVIYSNEGDRQEEVPTGQKGRRGEQRRE